MSFSLKPVSHSATAAVASQSAAMPAAGAAAATAGDGLFASLFAGQLGEGGQGQQADLTSLLGLPVATPATLEAPAKRDTPVTQVELPLAAQPAASDAAMMMQMSGLLQPPASLPPPVQEKQALPALGDSAQQQQQDQPGQPDQALLAAQAGMAALPLAAQQAATASPAASQPVATAAQVAQEAARDAVALAAPALLRPDPAMTKREAGGVSPAAASDVSKLLVDKAGQINVLPPAQTVAALAQQTGQQSGFTARDEAPMQAVAAPAHGKADILPADVRLMFRKEMQQAGLAEQAASAAADEAAEMVAGQRQILPPVLTTATPAAAAQTWRIDAPMARTAEWQSAFGEKVGSMVALKLDSASIRVSPENLGPLDISIRFDSQDQAAISVVAANPEAKAIVESSLPQLARMLENSGIQLGNTQVSTQHQQQAQQQAQEHAQQQAGRQGRQPGHAAGQEAALPEPEPALSAVSARQNGLSIHA